MPWRCMGNGCINPHFFGLALVGCEWSASRSCRLTLGKESPVPNGQEVSGPHSRSGPCGRTKILDPTGTRTLDPSVVQPIGSRYTNHSTAAHTYINPYLHKKSLTCKGDTLHHRIYYVYHAVWTFLVPFHIVPWLAVRRTWAIPLIHRQNLVLLCHRCESCCLHKATATMKTMITKKREDAMSEVGKLLYYWFIFGLCLWYINMMNGEEGRQLKLQSVRNRLHI
jgi:hypothetical protein